MTITAANATHAGDDPQDPDREPAAADTPDPGQQPDPANIDTDTETDTDSTDPDDPWQTVGRPILSLREYLVSDYEATRDMDPTRPHGLGRTLDVLTQSGFLSLALYRVTAATHRGGHRILARVLLHLNVFLFNCEIYPQTIIGPGATITHPLGVAIGAGVVMGQGVRIHGLVRIGTAGYEGSKRDGFPVIGDDCRLFDHCMLFGPIEIGARSKIGANALLLRSVPPDSIVVAPQGTLLER